MRSKEYIMSDEQVLNQADENADDTAAVPAAGEGEKEEGSEDSGM